MERLTEHKKQRIKSLIDQGVTRRRICEAAKVSNATIIRHFGESDRYRPDFDEERRQQVEKLSREGYSRRQICEILHMSANTITKYFGLLKWNQQKYNIKPRKLRYDLIR